jgi:pimeloyl-ACP methyl ester carboxylesterase
MKTQFHDEVKIPVGSVIVKGELHIPEDADTLIVFSHGSGSSRFSKRNQKVAEFLQEKGFGTLLFDLLTEQEDTYYYSRFNINLLSKRLVDATLWLKKFSGLKDNKIGYFGASTGAASALFAAAALPETGAVVSRGGRPDMAMDILGEVNSPTLLIVGSLDYEVLELNYDAYIKLKCEKKLEIVDGASHLFEEPGKLEIVSELAADWFINHLHPVSVGS